MRFSCRGFEIQLFPAPATVSEFPLADYRDIPFSLNAGHGRGTIYKKGTAITFCHWPTTQRTTDSYAVSQPVTEPALLLNAAAVCNGPLAGTAVPASGQAAFMNTVLVSTRILNRLTFAALSYSYGNRERGPR